MLHSWNAALYSVGRAGNRVLITHVMGANNKLSTISIDASKTQEYIACEFLPLDSLLGCAPRNSAPIKSGRSCLRQTMRVFLLRAWGDHVELRFKTRNPGCDPGFSVDSNRNRIWPVSVSHFFCISGRVGSILLTTRQKSITIFARSSRDCSIQICLVQWSREKS